MTNQLKISRRDFMKLAGTSLALSGAAPAFANVPLNAKRAQSAALRMGWWGEQEAPGLEAYLKKVIEKYKAKTGTSIETTLSTTDNVISDFQTASAAKNAPDIQYFWNGIYHMESVWLGYVEPLNGLIPDDVLKSSNATALSIYQGKQYRVGWYGQSILYVYNKELFSKAGLDPEKPPTTWDELLAACEKLKASGTTPIVGGLKDGPWGEWYMGYGLTQNLDSPADALNLFAANLDWRDPKYWEHWAKLEQLWKAGYINSDINSIELYPGIDLFGAGKGAMTAVAMALVPKLQASLGSAKIGTMIFPVFGKGKMAGKAIIDTSGIGISSQSANKKAAADFLQFLLQPEQLAEMFTSVKILPASTAWDGAAIKDATTRTLWEKWVKGNAGNSVPYISNLMPTLFWTDAMFVNSQKIVSGEFTGEQAGKLAADVAKKWREQNPDLLEKYTIWANDLKL